jgi:hypothetical protein
MSDGPHSSLPMRRRWKRVAECGDNGAFAPDEVGQHIAPALEDDCRSELRPGFTDALLDVYGSLFRDQAASELTKLYDVAGPGIGRVILDHAILLASHGETDSGVPLRAVTNALMDRAQRCSRQVEEHYLRESTEHRALQVRSRLEDGIARAGDAIDGLARQILRLEFNQTSTPQKQDGLDDGVQLQ